MAALVSRPRQQLLLLVFPRVSRWAVLQGFLPTAGANTVICFCQRADNGKLTTRENIIGATSSVGYLGLFDLVYSLCARYRTTNVLMCKQML